MQSSEGTVSREKDFCDSYLNSFLLEETQFFLRALESNFLFYKMRIFFPFLRNFLKQNAFFDVCDSLNSFCKRFFIIAEK